MTYWALGSKGMVGVEFLTGVAKAAATRRTSSSRR